jgi:hypothetical protein
MYEVNIVVVKLLYPKKRVHTEINVIQNEVLRKHSVTEALAGSKKEVVFI